MFDFTFRYAAKTIINAGLLVFVMLATTSAVSAATQSAVQTEVHTSAAQSANTSGLTALATMLRAQGDFQCALTQEKMLSGFKRPLRAFGRLDFAADIGLLYQLERPIRARYRMKDSGVEIIEADLPVRRLSSAELPWLDAISAIFQGALAGDWPRLQKHFSVQLTPAASSGQAWQLQLTPKSATLRSALRSVSVSGVNSIQQIELIDKNADQTLIQLTQCQPLEPKQRQALADVW